MIRRVFLIAIVALCVVYLCDYGVLRFRIAHSAGANSALGTVTVLYGAPLKDGKVEVFTDQPQLKACVRSIFPHLGYSPCWYASRHPVQIVN
ncbi:MAG TPA: hypothetical protein VEJ38_02075 [Candidatus Acidoferrales bacterium]|nr:hypothetical protein [Candidatus Acidoferrales bacterium]